MRCVLGFRDFIKFKGSKHIIHTIVQLRLWLNYNANGDLCGLVKYNPVKTNYKWLSTSTHFWIGAVNIISIFLLRFPM